jgi:hypothetical protein
MSEILDISDEEMLARLAACDLTAAERVHSRLMAAEEASDIAELGRTDQRIARSLRQTLALKAKFKREREADAKDTAPPATKGPMASAGRVREVRAAVARVAWNDAEADDWMFHRKPWTRFSPGTSCATKSVPSRSTITSPASAGCWSCRLRQPGIGANSPTHPASAHRRTSTAPPDGLGRCGEAAILNPEIHEIHERTGAAAHPRPGGERPFVYFVYFGVPSCGGAASRPLAVGVAFSTRP